jgi:hypothetical protein
MSLDDGLLDRVGDLYQKYPFTMSFVEFLEMVVCRIGAGRAVVQRGREDVPCREGGWVW